MSRKHIYWWEKLDVEPSEKENVHDFMEEKNFLWEVLSLPCYTCINGEYIEIDRNSYLIAFLCLLELE